MSKVKHKRDLAYAKEFVATMKRRDLSRAETIALLDEVDMLSKKESR